MVVRIALDTNAYSALIRGHRAVASLIRRAESVLVPAIVAGELLYGFRAGARYEENSARFEAFLATPHVDLIPVTLTTADRFGRIAAGLRKKGSPIPTNDIWIAALAMGVGADLLSSDEHFGAVDGLAWVPFSPDEGDSIRERVWEYHTTPES